MIGLLSKWPLVRQIRERKDGTGLESMSDKTRAMHARIDDAQVARSICPILRRRLRPVDLSQGRQTHFDRRRSRESRSAREIFARKARLPINCSHTTARNENEISRAAREGMDRDFAGSRDGHGGRSRLGIAQAHIRAQDKTARRSITRRRSAISAARRSTTKKIISSENCSLSAWGWCAYPTRRGYDIAARCPVWAPPSAGAELRPRNKISPTPIAF